jgi:glycerate dehydrogenase
MKFDRAIFLDRETVDNGDLNFERLDACASRWHWFDHSPAHEISARVSDCGLLVTNKCPIDRHIIASSKSLQLIVLCATGTDNIDLKAAAEHGVMVCNIRDYATSAVAQHTIGLILNLLTGQPWYRERVRQGEWSTARQFCLYDRPIREARGLTLGIIGHGVLGEAVSELARGLGMSVLLAERKDQSVRPGRTTFDDVVRSADVISIHCPLNAQTQSLFDRRTMETMKSDALIINTSRGGIVNEIDLAQSLRDGVIGGAAIDALSVEPPPLDHPLLAQDIPNLLVTPHNAWASRQARQAAVDQMAAVIDAFSAGRPINTVA